MVEITNKQKEKASSSNATASTILRAVLWIGLLIFAVFSYFEYQARNHYNETVSRLTQAWNAAKEEEKSLSREEIDKLIQGKPKITKSDDEMVHVTWTGFRSYVINLEVDGAGLASFTTGKDPE